MKQNAAEMAERYGLQVKAWQNEDGSKDESAIGVRIGRGYASAQAGDRIVMFAHAIGLTPTATVAGSQYLWARFDKAAFEAVSVELPELTFTKSKNATAAEPPKPAKPSFLSVVEDAEGEEDEEDEDPADADEEDGQGGN